MDKMDLNDYIVDVFQDFVEIESMLKILKNSICNEYNDTSMNDIENALEILISKMSNTKSSLDKYIDESF